MRTSEGPAGRSTETTDDTRCFAAATQRLPGPTILVQRATDTSPAMPCAPPARRTWSTPSSRAAQRSSGLPFQARGGVATTTRGTPATFAGITPIMRDEG